MPSGQARRVHMHTCIHVCMPSGQVCDAWEEKLTLTLTLLTYLLITYLLTEGQARRVGGEANPNPNPTHLPTYLLTY